MDRWAFSPEQMPCTHPENEKNDTKGSSSGEEIK
jgi:hypothetical protein